MYRKWKGRQDVCCGCAYTKDSICEVKSSSVAMSCGKDLYSLDSGRQDGSSAHLNPASIAFKRRRPTCFDKPTYTSIFGEHLLIIAHFEEQVNSAVRSLIGIDYIF